MATEITHKYRHKKFSQGKRGHDEDYFASPYGITTAFTDPNPPMVTIHCYNISNSSTSGEEITSAIDLSMKNKSKPEPTSHNEVRVKMELITLNEQQQPKSSVGDTEMELNPPKRRRLEAETNANVIRVKKEIIDPVECIPTTSIPKGKRPRSAPIKVEQEETSRTDDGFAIKSEETSRTDNGFQIESEEIPATVHEIPIESKETPTTATEELIEINANVPEIPREAYVEICKFRGNMVRKFPKKNRSAKEQERRDKNTNACRKSRRVKKIEAVAVEEEYKSYKDLHLSLTEFTIRAAAYFKELERRTQETVIVD